jgi:NADPH:quinone reductase-like Zn-dependent oxidoreductase
VNIIMKAAVIRSFGPPEVLKYEDVATPRPDPGNLLIRVLASGINRLDHYLREGSVTRDLKLPHILGSDASGVVAEIGRGVSGFSVGERVVPMPGYPLHDADEATRPISAAPSYVIGGIVRWGTYAEFIEVPARWVLKDATDLPPEAVATLPMALVTAVRAVKTVGEVADDQFVLIHAGASGTGSMNIQVAKALGARVATTVDSEEKAEFARALGADIVIDVTRADFVAACREWTGGRGLDVVIDNLGGRILQRSLNAARVGGTVVAMGFVDGVEVAFHIREFFFTHKRLLGTLMGDVSDLQWGLDMVKRGRIRPSLDRALPLEDAAEAHRLLAANNVRGNLVLMT